MDIDLKVVIAIVVVSAFLVAKLLEPSSKYSSLPPGPKVCCPAVARKTVAKYMANSQIACWEIKYHGRIHGRHSRNGPGSMETFAPSGKA